ncbi:MAG: DnaJ domain-containing protein [Chloroflexia bacterium]|nr:DnaJ domain-containing protein [Chloroflexia bacterium]
MPNTVKFKDYYSVLGVDRTADQAAIRSAFRSRAKKMHPDVNRDDPKAEEQFKDLNEAFEVLSDAGKRKMYDRFGEDWKRYQDAGVSPDERFRGGATSTRQATQGTPGAPEDFGTWFAGENGSFTFESADNGGRFSDFFNLLFGAQQSGSGRVRQSTARPRRGDDLEAPTTITMEEAATGTQRRLSVRTPGTCSLCKGAGEVRGGMCPRCDGSGTVPAMKELEVSIPKGVRTGSRVRVSGRGGPGMNGGPAGDVYLVIKLVPHPRFERAGDDLVETVNIPLYTAVLGGEVVVPTISGQVALTVPAGTQVGRQFRLRGKGMPKLGSTTGEAGDLRVRAAIELPVSLTDEQRTLFEQLRDLRSSKD